ncbi:MAG: DUF4153 domain-containing protein [Bacteroidota bacterium]
MKKKTDSFDLLNDSSIAIKKNENSIVSMKANILIALNAIVFAVLFYEQNPGINFLIFTLIYGVINFVVNSKSLSKKWYLAYSLNLLCAFNIFNAHTDLAVFAWVISFIYAIGKTFEIKNSILISTYFSFASGISSFEKIYKKYFFSDKAVSKSPKLIYLAAIFISFFVVLLFFFLYKGANPLFSDFTSKIDFSWLDVPLVFFTLFGFFLTFTLVYPYVNLKISSWDNNKIKELKLEDASGIPDETNVSAVQHSEIKKFVGLIAILVFICLNIMLLSLNSLDIKSLFITEKLPTNVFLSDFVNDAVACIVFSILFAIALIVGIQQFKIKNLFIKILIYTWIFQSVVMVFNTAIRNFWYSFNQITYLRIGVFVFLTLCIFGLIYTAYSLLKKRNYWFLMNINFQTWFYVLVLSSLFSWDRIITKHNLNYSKIEQIDIKYLNSLSENNIDLMWNFYQKHPALFEEIGYSRQTLLEELKSKKRQFNSIMKHKTWQNFNLMDNMIYQNLRKENGNSLLFPLCGFKNSESNLKSKAIFICDRRNLDEK